MRYLEKLTKYVHQHKYVILLIALMQHLFIGIFLKDMSLYTKIIWPINMLLLGVASMGVFIEKGIWKKRMQQILFGIVVLLPIGLPVFGSYPTYFIFLNLCYVVFFAFIFFEVLKFLIRPSYINTDIISASTCGLFLLIEISTFLMQYFVYMDPLSFKGLDRSEAAKTYMDLVYFSAITLTSIGFGDITPNSYNTKLITSLFGLAGQFYSVVLVGILISKFTASQSKN